MTPYELVLDAQLTAHAAHLVFEEGAERLDELEFHIVGESAHVVVALDCLGRTFDRTALNHVGVDGALAEPFGVGDELGFGIEDVDESLADCLALLLRVGDAGEDGIETVLGVDTFHVETHVLVGLEDSLELVFAEESVVNENAVKLMADGAVEEDGSDRGVDAAAEAEDYFVAAHFGFELIYGGLDERLGSPAL